MVHMAERESGLLAFYDRSYTDFTSIFLQGSSLNSFYDDKKGPKIANRLTCPMVHRQQMTRCKCFGESFDLLSLSVRAGGYERVGICPL